MDTNCLVTAIITTYKRKPEMLLEAVNSVLAQTYRPIELIVVSDNNPGDEYARSTKAACDACAGVRLIQVEKNAGAQAARNRGIRESKGDFVAFLDDDDIWVETKIEKQMALFDDPDVALVYCDAINFFSGDRNRRWIDAAGNYAADYTQELHKDIIGSTSKAVIRKSCFTKCGMFDENLKARQDYDRWLSITRHYKARGVPEPLLLYRIHESTQISKNIEKALDSSRYIYQKYRADFDRDPLAKMGLFYDRCTRCAHSGGNRGLMLYYALRAFCASPKGFIARRKLAHQ